MARKKAEAAEPQPQPPTATEPKTVTVMPEAAVPSAPAPTAVLANPPIELTPEISLDLATRRVKQFKGIVKLIAAETDPRDLFVFASYKTKTEEDLLKLKAYLPLHTCQSILAWAGALWMPDKEMIERRDHDELGGFIEYDQWVDVITGDNREVRVMGSCSTRHPFHGVAFTFYGCPSCRQPIAYGGQCDQHGKIKARKLPAFRPLCDINRGNVRKHAITNSFNKAVDALGFTPTLRDLKESGMDITRIPKASFGADRGEDEPGSAAPSSPQSPPQSAQPPQRQTQSTAAPASQKPQGQPSAAPPTNGPPKPAIPDKAIAGTLEEIKPGTTVPKDKATGKPTGKPGRPFLGLIVSGAKVTCFDNRELAIDTRGTKRKAFDLLMEALGAWVVLRVKKSGQYDNVSGYERIGDFEWDSEGVPILRRDPPQQAAPAGEVSDEDLPSSLFPPDW